MNRELTVSEKCRLESLDSHIKLIQNEIAKNQEHLNIHLQSKAELLSPLNVGDIIVFYQNDSLIKAKVASIHHSDVLDQGYICKVYLQRKVGGYSTVPKYLYSNTWEIAKE